MFSQTCDSVHRGGVCLSACWDTTPWSRHPPWEQTHTPPRSRPLPQSRHPPEQTPPCPRHRACWEIRSTCGRYASCDLNGSVRGRVSSSRKRFWTLPNLYSEVSKTKILLFSYWFFMQIGWRETLDTSEPQFGSVQRYNFLKYFLYFYHLEIKTSKYTFFLSCFLISCI